MKGHTNNPEGRPKGTPNKTTKELRHEISQLVFNNAKSAQEWLDRVATDNPAKALELLIKLMELSVPKPQEQAEPPKDGKQDFVQNLIDQMNLGNRKTN